MERCPPKERAREASEWLSHHRLAPPAANLPGLSSSRIKTGTTRPRFDAERSAGLSASLKSCLNQWITVSWLMRKFDFVRHLLPFHSRISKFDSGLSPCLAGISASMMASIPTRRKYRFKRGNCIYGSTSWPSQSKKRPLCSGVSDAMTDINFWVEKEGENIFSAGTPLWNGFDNSLSTMPG